MAGNINGRSTMDTDPLRNFRFLVNFLPHSGNTLKFDKMIGFTSVSGLQMTTESIPYREGGYNTSVHQIPGQTTFSPITLQRGVTLGGPQNWSWMRRLFQVANSGATGGAGQSGASFRSDVEIILLQHPAAGSTRNLGGAANSGSWLEDRVAKRWMVYNAWPTSLAYSDLNAGDNALLVEQMTLVHEGWDTKEAKNYSDTAPKFS